ncbi:putative threonine synthase-like 1-like [Apostichopus japonicus]|uniref:Putative threonine synthase-like 1-like n=1 Tax=Stichopus japonicus TaxID=307972 RepID=A0A2G8KYE3_STIJA|nr:putative threonine synthase-like 1-like [Apostichopus japonicus]
MGSPGCGKTTTGQLLSARLGRPVTDIDDDFLEPYWGMPVAHKLSLVGNKMFIQEEGSALLKFQANPGSIVSLTGSNPLHSEAMDHVARSGLVIFVDVHYEDILQRLHKMKVDRLVTHREGQSIADVLQYRRSFYEKAYDLRALCERFESVESVTTKIDRLVQNFSSPMNYASTRSDSDGKAIHHFQDVILRGLAEDGGLFVPAKNSQV